LPGLRALALAAFLPLAATGEPSSIGLEVFLKSDATIFQSPARTIGGVGAAAGARKVFERGLFVQAEVSYLFGLGNTLGLQLGFGYQRAGFYAPSAQLTASALVGGGLRFLTLEHPTAVSWPALSAGVTIAPLRFSRGGAHVSLLEVGAGLGSDFPGLASCFRLSILQIGLAL
jgi:hypothetical protein